MRDEGDWRPGGRGQSHTHTHTHTHTRKHKHTHTPHLFSSLTAAAAVVLMPSMGATPPPSTPSPSPPPRTGAGRRKCNSCNLSGYEEVGVAVGVAKMTNWRDSGSTWCCRSAARKEARGLQGVRQSCSMKCACSYTT